MRKSNIISAILSTASLLWFAPAHAQAEKVTLDYHLPEVKIGFAVSHMITKCPDAKGKGLELETITAIKPIYSRGEEIKVNPKGNLFVDRQVKLEYHENGTIKSFNGSSTGQGGKIVAAVIKAATFAATTAMGVPSVGALDDKGNPPLAPIACNSTIVNMLKEKESLKGELASLKQALISQGPSENLLARITLHEAALADTILQLTISSSPAIWSPTASTTNLPINPSAADLTGWFDGVSAPDLQLALTKAGMGHIQSFKTSAVFASTPDPTTIKSTVGTSGKIRALVYREPGMVDVTLVPVADFDPGDLKGVEALLAKATYEATKAKATVKVPQIGTLKVIPFDGSGIFGSRAVAATFDQMGELTSIGYASTGGADALAGVVDASVAAAIELRDQEPNAIKGDIERRTQTNALKALIDAEAEAKN